MCINFGQRHLAAKGLAGFCLCGNARPGKAESRLMGNFHQGEQIRRVGAIPLEQGIENIKSNRFAYPFAACSRRRVRQFVCGVLFIAPVWVSLARLGKS